MKAWLLVLATVFFPWLALKAQEPDAAKCTVHVLADDRFEMFVNGKPVWKAASWDKAVSQDVMIQAGDVVVFAVTDDQGGKGGALSVVIVRGFAVAATTRNFLYTPVQSPELLSAKKVNGLKAPEFSPLPKIRSFGLGKEREPAKAWSKNVDQDHATIYFRWVADK
ncbi:hypothetical protein [Luteolibacter sp. Populi]|uniref:hypothetical protein n=1 Tax=Luteolibacter sp. Populi TaxID=3230487 RepID=UPI0034672877